MCRFIASLALLGFLAGQFAAVSHAHAAAVTDHEARPHVHLRGVAHAHGHPHSHDCGHCHTHGPVSDSAATEPKIPVDGPDSHDSDAIFLSDDAPVRAPSFDSLNLWLAVFLVGDAPLAIIVENGLVGSQFPPPGSLPGQERLFLEVRSLRI